MDRDNSKITEDLHDLNERAKELRCLYHVNELLNRTELSLAQILRGIVEVLPRGVAVSRALSGAHSFRGSARSSLTAIGPVNGRRRRTSLCKGRTWVASRCHTVRRCRLT